MEAFLDAERQGRPLNAHLTVTYDGSGMKSPDVDRAVELHGKLFTSIRKCLARYNHPFVYTYAWASAETGLHAHTLLHIEPSRWKEIKAELVKLIDRRLRDLGVKERREWVNGKPWLIFTLTPPQAGRSVLH